MSILPNACIPSLRRVGDEWHIENGVPVENDERVMLRTPVAMARLNGMIDLFHALQDFNVERGA